MKKLFIFVIVLFWACFAFADESHKFYIDLGNELEADGSDVSMKGYTLEASGSETVTIDLNNKRPQGFTSLEVNISGSGTLRIYHESSITGADYNTITVNGTVASDVITALTAGSELYQFNTPFARYLKLWFVETGGGSSVTIDNIALQVQ